jgi:hypothetical protein
VLKTTNVAYTATRDNLASTSKDLDDAMIWEQEANKLQEQAEARLADAEKRLVVADGENKTKGCCWKRLGKRCPSVKIPLSR